MKKISTIAKAIMSKNPELVTLVEGNAQSYKALEPRITARFVATVGRQEGQFIKRNELIWACINTCQDEAEDELDY